MPESRGDSADEAPAGRDDVVDALLAASRALVGLAARSLAGLNSDVTLPQYRALVVLAARGPQRVADVSAELGVSASTGTRMCERLVRKGLIRRTRLSQDRRIVRIALTPTGRTLVATVMRRRREELTRIVTAMPEAWRNAAVAALRSFAEASREVPEREWWLGWHDDRASDTAQASR